MENRTDNYHLNSKLVWYSSPHCITFAWLCISNLCTISKVYEKLILKYLLKISKANNVDLTGDSQHGFKEGRSTVTAALTIQSIISRALDEDNFYVLASLDLSAAFDLVNRELLFKRMEIMGIPPDVVLLLKDWLSNRKNHSLEQKQCIILICN